MQNNHPIKGIVNMELPTIKLQMFKRTKRLPAANILFSFDAFMLAHKDLSPATKLLGMFLKLVPSKLISIFIRDTALSWLEIIYGESPVKILEYK